MRQFIQLDDRRFISPDPDQVLWPEDGITRADLVDYYVAVAPWLMPFVVDRPLSFLRAADGVTGECTYQKNAPPGLPPWVATRHIRNQHAVSVDSEYVVGSDRAALVYMVSTGALSPHPWSCTVRAPDRPDQLLLDLDPFAIAFREVRNAALLVRDLLASFGIRSWVKTSGGAGLHIMVPLAPVHTFGDVLAATETVTRLARSREPSLFTMDMRRARRRGKILLDVHRNHPGATLVSAYAVREFSSAPVSTPLDWSELTRPIYPEEFCFKTIRERLHTSGDPAQDFFAHRQSLAPLLDSAKPRRVRATGGRSLDALYAPG